MIGGTTYIATALIARASSNRPARTGASCSARCSASCRDSRRASERSTRRSSGADIQSEAVEDGRVPIWEKFIFLVALAGFTGASRLPIGPLWADPKIREQFLEACREVERVARAEGVPVRADVIDRIPAYVGAHPRHDAIVAADRSVAGKADRGGGAAGSVVRRAAAAGVPVPIMSTLYALLKPFAAGPPPPA